MSTGAIFRLTQSRLFIPGRFDKSHLGKITINQTRAVVALFAELCCTIDRLARYFVNRGGTHGQKPGSITFFLTQIVYSKASPFCLLRLFHNIIMYLLKIAVTISFHFCCMCMYKDSFSWYHCIVIVVVFSLIENVVYCRVCFTASCTVLEDCDPNIYKYIMYIKHILVC